MTDTTKKSAKRLTEEEKSGINQMLMDKKPHKEIIEKYNISVGTVSNMVKKLSGKTIKSTEYKESKHIAALNESLTAIQNRKNLVEEMLQGSLKQELEQLTIAENNLVTAIDSIKALEALAKNK